MLRLVNDAGGDEHEHGEVDHRDDNFFMAAEVGQVGAQLHQHVIGAQQPHRAQDAQEAHRFARERREKRDDRGDVGPGRNAHQLAHRLWADDQPRQEISEDDEAKGDVERLEPRPALHERRGDDEDHGEDVEDQQGVAEAVGAFRGALVEAPQGLGERQDGFPPGGCLFLSYASRPRLVRIWRRTI